jgi:5-hydroxyisourate hydrolase-like protein (transthyretin family)
MSNLIRDKGKPVLFCVSSVILLLSVSVSILAAMGVQPIGNSAFAQTSILRTTELKVNFKKLVEVGSDQNVRVMVTDQGTGDPVSSANVRLTIYFPAGAPIRQFNLLTNEDGKASLTLPVDENAPLGQYGLDVLAGALGYFDSAVGTVAWAVNSEVDEDVSLDDYKHTSHTID